MKISIITVCRNSEATINETLQSVFNQTYQNIEYIIIDGGSTDNTINIIEKYKDKISKFVCENDNGIYDAMNKGISLATGEILYFLNSDDLLASNNVIELIANHFKNEPNLDVLYGDVMYGMDENSDKSDLSDIDKLSIEFFTPSQQSFFYKESAFEKCGTFDDRFKIYGDVEWLKRAIRKKLLFGYIDLTIAKFRMGGASQSIQTENLRNKDRELLLEIHPINITTLNLYNRFYIKNYNFLYKYFRSLTRIKLLKKFTKKLFRLFFKNFPLHENNF